MKLIITPHLYNKCYFLLFSTSDIKLQKKNQRIINNMRKTIRKKGILPSSIKYVDRPIKPIEDGNHRIIAYYQEGIKEIEVQNAK